MHAAGVAEESQQAARRHVGVERAVFRQVAQPLGALQAVGRHVVPGDPGRALRRGQVAGQQLHGGALAGPVGAQEGRHFALVDRKGDVPRRGKIAVELRKPDRPRSSVRARLRKWVDCLAHRRSRSSGYRFRDRLTDSVFSTAEGPQSAQACRLPERAGRIGGRAWDFSHGWRGSIGRDSAPPAITLGWRVGKKLAVAIAGSMREENRPIGHSLRG